MTDDRYWILDAGGKNGITLSKKRRLGDTEIRRNGCFADEKIVPC